MRPLGRHWFITQQAPARHDCPLQHFWNEPPQSVHFWPSHCPERQAWPGQQGCPRTPQAAQVMPVQ
jgi:hypothetical protein